MLHIFKSDKIGIHSLVRIIQAKALGVSSSVLLCIGGFHRIWPWILFISTQDQLLGGNAFEVFSNQDPQLSCWLSWS